jgi:beta-galactosidase
MGCNAIRTSHNPPAIELLELCDKMGFIVMDEAFDMWKKQKNKFDYHLDWDQWHERDLRDQLMRDRNHPSVFMWSIGNEISEQGWGLKDTSGRVIGRELVKIVRSMDTSRIITSAFDNTSAGNNIILSGAIEMIGFNYHHKDYAIVQQRFPGKPFIGSETVSALQTRGYYEMPSDSIRRWPTKDEARFKAGSTNLFSSAYDNVSASWGSTHEETLKLVEKNDFIAGQFIWTGFDYLGEPTPYPWPARSSYFGIVDLAGFPKDVYWLYQSIWTKTPVLHLFPHWNWKEGEMIDVWAYYNNADEVELFLNNQSLGIKKKTGDDLHIQWRVPFKAGTLKAVSRLKGKTVLITEQKTAGKAAKLVLLADRNEINADGKDLSFITVKVVDENGVMVPDAANNISFSVKGAADIIATDGGNPISLESFQSKEKKAFNGLCLAILQAKESKGEVIVKASSTGLPDAFITIKIK